jgi:hypothetical protein
MEIPISAKATINPAYGQPINGPIEFHIPEQGQWELEQMIANQTKINTQIGTSGVNTSMHGDDDCGEDPCSKVDACLNPEDDFHEYCNCVRNCFGSDGENMSTDLIPIYQNIWKTWRQLKEDVMLILISISEIVELDEVDKVTAIVDLIVDICSLDLAGIAKVFNNYLGMTEETMIKINAKRKAIATKLSSWADSVGDSLYKELLDDFATDGSPVPPEVIFEIYLG